MAKTFFTLAVLAAQAGPYFASNPDLGLLLGTTHDGVFYRPEMRSFAEHEARKAQAEVLEILLDDYRAAALPGSLAGLVAGAQYVYVTDAPAAPLPAAPAPADEQPADVPAPVVVSEAPARKGRKAPTPTKTA